MESEFKSKSRKISSYLPSDLCEDLSLNDDSSVDEINEVISPILKNRKLKSNRRRSSSFDFHDLHLNLLEINPLDHRDYQINTNTKFIRNLIETNSKSVKRINNSINLLNEPTFNNNIITINNKEENNNTYINQDYQNLILIMKNNNYNTNTNNNNPSISNNVNNINIKHSILKKQKSNKNISNNKSNEKIKNQSKIQKENYEIIIPRKKTSDNSLQNIKTVKFNIKNSNNENYINSVNGISIQKIPKTPVKKYSCKNNSQREFIDPDILNTNQTFKEFLNNTGNKLSSIMKASIGSRFLQKMLDKIDEDDIEEIFFKIGNDINDLICDNYANYFLQQLILKCNLKQRLYLYDKLKKNFIKISKNISGTYCIQKLIEKINNEKEEELLKNYIQENLLELSFDTNSNHVIQKIIYSIKENERQYINDFIYENIVILCKDVNGICIIKKFISENNNIVIMNEIIKLLTENCLEITQDQFGNYAIQYAIEKYGFVNCYNFIRIIYQNIVFLSCQKFSSNVIDKIVLLSYQCNYQDYRLLMEIMFFNIQNFNIMSQNKFGMFVLQNSLKLMNINNKVIIRNFLGNKIQIDFYDNKNQLQKLIQLLSF